MKYQLVYESNIELNKKTKISDIQNEISNNIMQGEYAVIAETQSRIEALALLLDYTTTFKKKESFLLVDTYYLYEIGDDDEWTGNLDIACIDTECWINLADTAREAFATYQKCKKEHFFWISYSVLMAEAEKEDERIKSLDNEADEDAIEEYKEELISLTEKWKRIKLGNLRIATGMSQAQFSKKSDIPIKTIQAYESGQRDINGSNIDTLLKIANALKIKFTYLLTAQNRDNIMNNLQ